MKNFKYKINKAINLGIVEDCKNEKDINKILKISIFGREFKIEKEQNKNISKEKILEIIDIFSVLDKNLENVFNYEKFFKFTFNSLFYYSERKKLEQSNLSEEVVNNKIYFKYKDVFRNFQKNIYFLNKHFETPKERLEKLTNILKTIRYLKYDLEKLIVFLENFNYLGEFNLKKESIQFLEEEIINLKYFSEKILNYYSKKSGKGDEIFKVALNPSIFNTNTEINKEYQEKEIKKLKEKMDNFEFKNEENKKIKREFLDYIDSYMNHILYGKGFFKNTTNNKWKVHCKNIFEEMNNIEKCIKISTSQKYFIDFLEKNLIKESNEIYFDTKIKNKLLIQKGEISGLESYNFLQINTLKYQLLWKKIELKEKNKDYKKLSKYITLLKAEINNRLRKGEYGNFIGFGGDKIKDAQDFSQVKNEYINKSNFDKELKAYNKFGYLIKGGNRVFLYLLDKKEIVNENGSFTYELAEKEIEKYKTEKSDYKAFIFQSLTMKGLTKLIFLKNAFGKDFKNKDRSVLNIYKQKSYAENRNGKYNNHKNNLKLYIEFFIECLKSKKGKNLFSYVDVEKFKKVEEYKTLIDFEKDLLKKSYKINEFQIDISRIDKDRLFELDIVNRKFEKEGKFRDEVLQLKRQNNIHIFYDFLDNISEENNYENLRLLPEIKLYLNTKLKEESIDEKEKRKLVKLENGKIYEGYEIFHKKRFFRNKFKTSFLFEYNPIEINKKPKHIKEEKKKYFQIIKEQYKNNNNNFNIIGIDIGEKEFATLGIFDKNLNSKNIKINKIIEEKGKKELVPEIRQIVDLTNLKLEKGDIVEKDSRNSEKYHFLKSFYEQIIYYQINLKNILENIGEIEIKKEDFQSIKENIGKSVDKFLNKDFDFNKGNNKEYIEKFFTTFIGEEELNFLGLKSFIFNFIKIKEGKINILDNYDEIFKQLEMMKVINFKDAFGSNFVGVIKQILKNNPGIIVFENLWNNKQYDFTHIITNEQYENLSSKDKNIMKSFGSYVGNYIFKSIVNSFSKIFENGEIKQYVYFDKNITNTLESEDIYGTNGIIFWIEAEGTSSTCPKCKNKIFRNKKEGVILHDKKSPGKNGCNFYINENKGEEKSYEYNGIKFKNGDQLATYNIAKRGINILKK